MNEIQEDFKLAFSQLSEEEQSRFGNFIQIRQFKKGEHLFKIGDTQRNIFIIIEGIALIYIITFDGFERTMEFAKESDSVSSGNNFSKIIRPSFGCKAIEPVTALCFDTNVFDQLADKNPNLLKLKIEGFKSVIEKLVYQIELLNIYTPEARFIKLRQDHPSLWDRVPQKYLASYIGITPQSFSRIKNRILKRKI